MTVGGLIVYNSTIAAGQGTVLQHLMNIDTAREVFCGISAEVAGDVNITVSSAIISANIKENTLIVNIIDGTDISTATATIGVNL